MFYINIMATAEPESNRGCDLSTNSATENVVDPRTYVIASCH